MNLQDFLQGDFGIISSDGVPTMIIETIRHGENLDGSLDETKKQIHETLEVSKNSFYKEVVELIEDNNIDDLLNHPAKFIRCFAIDIALKGKIEKRYRQRPTIMLEEFSSYTASYTKEMYIEEHRILKEAFLAKKDREDLTKEKLV